MNTIARPSTRQSINELVKAIKRSDLAALDAWLKAGVDPNATDDKGDTLAHVAAAAGRAHALKRLLDAGATPDGTKGREPLWIAVKTNCMMVGDLIKAGAATDLKNEQGMNLLHVAAQFGMETVVPLLLKAGIPVNSRTPDGFTPLHFATPRPNFNVVQDLIDSGAEINARSNKGTTPIMLGLWPALFEFLTPLGGDPLARDTEGNSAFDLALKSGNAGTAFWLLSKYPALAPTGAALDKAFVLAIRSGEISLVKELISLGADIGQKPGGRTLVQCAPREAEELKRLLRSLKTGQMLDSAMSGTTDSCAANTPSIL